MDTKGGSKKIFRIGKSLISVDKYTYGFENIAIRQWGEGASLNIGKFCSIARSVTVFLGGNHRTDWITTFPFGHIYQQELGSKKVAGHPSTGGNVNIGNDVWIGHGVTLISGVSIGNGAVIAANSNVVKDVGDYEVVGGNPAQRIKSRFNENIIAKLIELKWWDLDCDQIKDITPFLCSLPNEAIIDDFIAKYRKQYI